MPVSIPHNLSFLPPSAHKAYQVLRNQHLHSSALPPLPTHSRAPATTPSKPLDSFDLDGLFPTSDDIMLLQNKAFGFASYSPPPAAADMDLLQQQPAAALLDETLTQPPFPDFGALFEDPTPNLDYSPLTSFSASPEWTAQPLFGDAGKEAGVVDDSPLFAAEDSFDFDFAGPSLFGDAPLFPPSKSGEPAPTPSAFAALEASLAHLPVNPSLSIPSHSSPALPFALPASAPAPPAPVAAPTASVFSPALQVNTLFPPSPQRQASSPLPASAASTRPPPAARRTSAPTGHRKGVEPSQLLDLDAPTQARSYVAPSATSRKRLPAAFESRAGKAKKRKGSPEDDDSAAASKDGDEPPAELADSIEAKRRQNTLAARRSRIRKLEHVKNLESSVASLSEDKAQLLAFAELAMRLHPELAAVDCWGPRVAAIKTGDEALAEDEMKRRMDEAFGAEED